MAGSLDVGTLSGRIELEDNMSSKIDLILAKVNTLGEGHGVKDMAQSFAIGELAVEAFHEALKLIPEALDFAVEGAKVADVTENFEHLTEQAGRLSSTLLGALREGTHNTITDFELMKTVNQDLSAGMKLTDEQFGIMTKGAFALAQATGTTVAQALDTMNNAMLTGRTRAIALRFGKIDLATAEANYAEAIGKTGEKLSAEEKLEADRGAILDKVAQSTKRLGEQTDGLDEKVDQAKVKWKNFTEELGASIARSPVVIGAMDGIAKAVEQAFGKDKEQAIHNITEAVGLAAKVIEAASIAVVTAASLGSKAWTVFSEGIHGASDSLAYLILRTQGLSAEQAHLAVNTQGVVNNTNQLAAAAKAAAEAHAQELAEAAKLAEIEEVHARNAQAIHKIEVQQAKEREDALNRLNAARASLILTTDTETEKDRKYAEVVSTLTAKEVEAIKVELQHGASVADIAKIYDKTGIAIEAVAHQLEKETAMEKGAVAVRNEILLAGEHYKVLLEGISGAALGTALSQLRLGASIKSVQEELDLTDIQADAVNKRFQEQQNEAASAAAHLSKMNDTLEATTQRENELAEAAKKANRELGGTFQITSANFEKAAASQGLDMANAIRLAKKGYSFSEIIQYNGIFNPPPPQGPRIPGFRQGGSADFGDGTLAILHGKETIVPEGAGGTTGVVNHFYVNGTADDVARKIAEIFSRQAMAGRQFPVLG